MNGWPLAFVALLYFVWNVTVLGTTAYVVFWLGHSGWWFLFALICCGSFTGFVETSQGGKRSEAR